MSDGAGLRPVSGAFYHTAFFSLIAAAIVSMTLAVGYAVGHADATPGTPAVPANVWVVVFLFALAASGGLVLLFRRAVNTPTARGGGR